MKSRRRFVGKSLLALGAAGLVSPVQSFNIVSRATSKGEIVGHGDFKYRVNKEWGVQDPSSVPVKDCHEMVQDRKGRLILLTNHTNNNVIFYDKSGKVKSTWGGKFPGAHGLTLSQEGEEDFLFITDHDRHMVFKTTLDGKILMELEYPKETGVYEEPGKYKPTEVAVAPNGDFYVADGYGQNYIIQYSASGEYIRHFGGTGDGEEQFQCCHGVTLDTRDVKNPTLLISSRTKQEFKRFTLEGKHLETIQIPGAWVCRPVIKGENLYFAVIVTKTWDSFDGMIAVLDKNNKVVSFPGGMAPDYENGKLKPASSDRATFFNPHDVCIDDDENIYVPQWASKNTYPVKLERI
ncbi:MAG: 6-bladed beta-propeller [Cyclobacteriaceae bacterium]|nr:6-bladed beta-propeller [Cyclobacteriaceae bacterium]